MAVVEASLEVVTAARCHPSPRLRSPNPPSLLAGEATVLLRYCYRRLSFHGERLLPGEGEGKGGVLLWLSRCRHGNSPANLLTAHCWFDVEEVRVRCCFTGLPSPPPSSARSKRSEGSPLLLPYSDCRNRVAASTAVNHNRHHGCRGGFAGGRHNCEMPPQPTLAVSESTVAARR
nr:hypothetical protein Itr_chr10CG13030 [Ipomoea trifida]